MVVPAPPPPSAQLFQTHSGSRTGVMAEPCACAALSHCVLWIRIYRCRSGQRPHLRHLPAAALALPATAISPAMPPGVLATLCTWDSTARGLCSTRRQAATPPAVLSPMLLSCGQQTPTRRSTRMLFSRGGPVTLGGHCPVPTSGGFPGVVQSPRAASALVPRDPQASLCVISSLVASPRPGRVPVHMWPVGSCALADPLSGSSAPAEGRG